MKKYKQFISENLLDLERMLIHSCKQGNIDEVKKLIEKGVDINIQFENGLETPLIWSCIYNHFEITKYLIEKGANIYLLDSNKKDALFYSLHYNGINDTVYLLTQKMLKDNPTKASEIEVYLTPEQKEKYKEFLVLSKDFDLFEGNLFKNKDIDEEEVRNVITKNNLSFTVDYSIDRIELSKCNIGLDSGTYLLALDLEIFSPMTSRSRIYLNGNDYKTDKSFIIELLKFYKIKNNRKPEYGIEKVRKELKIKINQQEIDNYWENRILKYPIGSEENVSITIYCKDLISPQLKKKYDEYFTLNDFGIFNEGNLFKNYVKKDDILLTKDDLEYIYKETLYIVSKYIPSMGSYKEGSVDYEIKYTIRKDIILSFEVLDDKQINNTNISNIKTELENTFNCQVKIKKKIGEDAHHFGYYTILNVILYNIKKEYIILQKDFDIFNEEYNYDTKRFEIGDKVRIKSTSRFYYQQFHNGIDRGIGTVYEDYFYAYHVKWNDEYTNLYGNKDLELIIENPDDDSEFEFGFENEEYNYHSKKFEKGDKVICIDNRNIDHKVKLNKVYDVIIGSRNAITNKGYITIDIDGEEYNTFSDRYKLFEVDDDSEFEDDFE